MMPPRLKATIASSLLLLLLPLASQTTAAAAASAGATTPTTHIHTVDDCLKSMSLEAKIAQMNHVSMRLFNLNLTHFYMCQYIDR